MKYVKMWFWPISFEFTTPTVKGRWQASIKTTFSRSQDQDRGHTRPRDDISLV